MPAAFLTVVPNLDHGPQAERVHEVAGEGEPVWDERHTEDGESRVGESFLLDGDSRHVIPQGSRLGRRRGFPSPTPPLAGSIR